MAYCCCLRVILFERVGNRRPGSIRSAHRAEGVSAFGTSLTFFLGSRLRAPPSRAQGIPTRPAASPRIPEGGAPRAEPRRAASGASLPLLPRCAAAAATKKSGGEHAISSSSAWWLRSKSVMRCFVIMSPMQIYVLCCVLAFSRSYFSGGRIS
jgi:hypothetical protein